MADVLIIGGGVAGLTAAAALAPHMSVTLIEAETAFGYHASGRSAAQFVEGYGNDTVRVLNRASRPIHQQNGVLSPRAVLILAGAGHDAAFASECSEMAAQRISLETARTLVPILRIEAVSAAAIAKDAFDIDTHEVLQQAARTARRHGAELVTGHRVTSMKQDGGTWRVQAGEEIWAAPRLVNAAGAWADEIATLAGVRPLGLTPLRRSMARLPAPGGHALGNWPMLLAAGEAWYAKPDAGAWIVSPGEADPLPPQDAWADDMVIAEGLHRYQAFVTEEVTRVETTWAGLRTFTPDRTPAIGADADRPGFFWLAGQGGYGFQTAPAAAAHLASVIKGERSVLDPWVTRALDPARFHDQTNSGR